MGRLPMHHPVAVWQWVLRRAVGLARAEFACLSAGSLILIGTGVCISDSAQGVLRTFWRAALGRRSLNSVARLW